MSGQPSYTKPPEFSTGQIIGRANLGILRDNDEYFSGLADRHRAIACTMYNDSLAGQVDSTQWDGFILLRADATTLHWAFQLTAGSLGAVNCRLELYDDNDSVIVLESLNAAKNTTISSSVNTMDWSTGLSGVSAGLHRLRLYINSKPSNDSTCRARFTTPVHCTYTGSESYTTPPTITDGNTSAVGTFNTWRGNDLYFNACKPVNPACVGIKRSVPSGAGTADEIVWDGWIRHRLNQVHWLVNLNVGDGASNSDNVRLVLYYDYDGTTAQTTVLTHNSDGDNEGTYDLPTGVGAGFHSAGSWYRVTAVLKRDAAGWGHSVTVKYLYMAPTADEAGGGLSVMGNFTVGDAAQWVYGSTVGQDTRLQLLSSNDANVFPRLCWSASVGRYDFAVRQTNLVRLGGTDSAEYRLKRIYDTLYYRGSNVTMRWGDDESQTLDDVTSGYGTVDLNGLTNLPHGTIYYLEGSATFAMEI